VWEAATVNNGPLGVLSTPLAAVELNLLVAGIEAAATVQTWRWLVFNTPIVPPLPAAWQWGFAVYAVFGLIGIFLLGLGVEGLAGLLERAVTRKPGGELYSWYVKATKPPATWGHGQLWIWKSPQAADEFARRRLRILVTRNTWFLTTCLTLSGLVGLLCHHGPEWQVRALILGPLGILATALFFWLWVSANEGWHKAVADASMIGPP
jgi:hypothetical protein